jgi:hypothetical protein
MLHSVVKIDRDKNRVVNKPAKKKQGRLRFLAVADPEIED